MSATLKELLKKGARDGYVTVGEINTLIAESGMEPDSIYAQLDEKEIEVRDANTSEVEETLVEAETAEPVEVLAAVAEESEVEKEAAEENAADAKAALDELLDDPVKNYLKQIGQIPLLSAEQEVELSRRIHAGAEAAHILQADRQKYGGPEYIKKNSARFSFEEDENSRSYTEDLDEDGEKSAEDAEEKKACITFISKLAEHV